LGRESSQLANEFNYRFQNDDKSRLNSPNSHIHYIDSKKSSANLLKLVQDHEIQQKVAISKCKSM